MRFPNVYGIDMPTSEELIAHDRDVAEICALIGADGLIYQELDALVASARRGNSEIKEFEQSCFSGEYITGDVSELYLQRVGMLRSDDAKQRRGADDDSLRDLFVGAGAASDGGAL